MPSSPTMPDPLSQRQQRALVEALEARSAYAVVYHHEHGPLIGIVGEFVMNITCSHTGRVWATFVEARTDERLQICEDQLASAIAIDGPWMSDAEVSALV